MLSEIQSIWKWDSKSQVRWFPIPGKVDLKCSLFFYPPSSGIASCVGTAGMVTWCLHLTRPCCVALGRVLIWVVSPDWVEEHISKPKQPFSLPKLITHVCGHWDHMRKLTSPAWKLYYSFSREIVTFGEFFRSKDFFKKRPLLYMSARVVLTSTKNVKFFWTEGLTSQFVPLKEIFFNQFMICWRTNTSFQNLKYFLNQ